MKRFMAMYTGTAAALEKSGWKTMDEDTRREREGSGMQAWHDWVETNRTHIVDFGAPLGRTKRVGADGITDITNSLAGYVVVQAESYDAAARLFVNHPHFAIFPGDSVEIMECLPLPEMEPGAVAD